MLGYCSPNDVVICGGFLAECSATPSVRAVHRSYV